MQIISRRVNQGIVFDGQTRVTVVEISEENVTLEITGSGGDTERVTLRRPSSDRRADAVEELALVTC